MKKPAENATDVRKTQTEETADATAAEDPVTEVNDDDFYRTWAESEAEWEAFQKVLHAVNKPSGTDTLSDSATTKTDDTMAGTVESAANTAASQTETSVPAAKDAMTQELERLIRGHEMLHVHNTCARWCFGNVRCSVDGNENIKPMKNKSTGRIDIAVAWIIAMATEMVARNQPGGLGAALESGEFSL